MADFTAYLRELQKILGELPLERLKAICDVLLKAYEENRKVFVFGNGGSAALASHIACDLGKGTQDQGPELRGARTGRRFKVLSLTDNVPLITAWANDASYEDVFAEQMENFVEHDDVVFAISSSGNSPNILKALRRAKDKGAICVGLTGSSGGKMKDLLDHGVAVPSFHMQQVEDVHLILAHLIFLDLRTRMMALNSVSHPASVHS